MKSKIKYFLCGGLAAALIGAAAMYASAAATPGGTDDPLVSKSYVDGQITQLKNYINNIAAAISSSDTTAATPAPAPTPAEPTPAPDVYTPVSVQAGQLIIGHQGTEIILRSGTALAFCPGSDGLTDVTDGADIANNVAVKSNHMIIFPRTDGRGVVATTDSWFMIKGGYELN